MASLYRCRSALVLLLISFLVSQVRAQSCNTNQNPYCAGNSQFAQLCCPYPAVCYYADRYGAVACCQAGQICRGTGITITAAQTTQITQTIQATQTTQTTYATQTTQPTQTMQTGGYSTITVTSAVATTAVASIVTTTALPVTTVATAIGYTTTAGVIIANGASRPLGTRHPTYFSVGLAILAWIMT
jgi:hypothetical protein